MSFRSRTLCPQILRLFNDAEAWSFHSNEIYTTSRQKIHEIFERSDTNIKNDATDLWMNHYSALMKLCPVFQVNAKQNMNCGEINTYVKHLKSTGKECPNLPRLMKQMTHIALYGKPLFEIPKVKKVKINIKSSMKGKRGKPYGPEFWMNHYDSLLKLYPKFQSNCMIHKDEGEVRRYMKCLHEKGEDCPGERQFGTQMRHIAQKGKPMCGKSGPKKGGISFKQLPNHAELMRKLLGMPIEHATQRYNEEIQKQGPCKVSENAIAVKTMQKWRDLFACEGKEKDTEIIKETLIIPQWLLESDKAPNENSEKTVFKSFKRGQSFGDDFWKHHIKSLVRMFPEFLQNYENGISRGEINQYRKYLKKNGEFCPSDNSFYKQIKDTLKLGDTKDGHVLGGRQKKLPDHSEIMQRLKDLPPSEAVHEYNKEIQKHWKGKKEAYQIGIKLMESWLKLLNVSVKIDDKEQRLNDYWMKHYDTLVSMYPNFSEQCRMKMHGGSIARYLHGLHEKGEPIPQYTDMLQQMRNIATSGRVKYGKKDTLPPGLV